LIAFATRRTISLSLLEWQRNSINFHPGRSGVSLCITLC